MLAVAGFKYNEAFDMVKKWTMDAAQAGRQVAHAMAHGSFSCRKYTILYDETSGTFALTHL